MASPESLAAELLLRHGAWLAQLARALVANDDEIDDVLQQTFTHALAAPPRNGTNLRAWLGSIARNVIRSRRRSAAARASREELAPKPPPIETPDELVARAELRRAVVDAVLALAEPYRSAVIRRYFEEQEVAAIAQITQAPEATVRTRIRRGVEQVRAALQARALLFMRLQEFARGPAPTATAAATSALVTGGVVMSIAMKWTMAAAAVVAVGVSVWIARGGEAQRLELGPARSRLPQAAEAAAALAAPEIASREIERTAESPETHANHADATPASVPNTDCSVHGVVRGPFDRPAAGVEVMAIIAPRYSPPSIDEMAAVAKEDPGVNGRWRATCTTLTDGAGRFTLSGLSDEEGWVVGAVDADGACAASDRFQFSANQRAVELALTLVACAELSGRVVASDGTPIGGARVAVSYLQGEGREAMQEFASVIAGRDAGTFSTGRRWADSFVVRATAPGYVQREPSLPVSVPPGQHAATVEIVLEPKAGVLTRGPIVDDSGRRFDLHARMAAQVGELRLREEGLARLCVAAVAETASAPEVGQPLVQADSETGRVLFDECSYEFRLLATFRGWIALALDGRVVGRARVDEPSNAPPLPFARLLPERAPDAAIVVVRVVDGATGAAIDALLAGVNVDPVRATSSTFPKFIAAGSPFPAGTVAFEVPLGRVAVRASRPGFVSSCPEMVLSKAGERIDVTVTLSSADCGIRGCARNRDGSPIAGANVNVYRATGSGFEGVPIEPAQTNGEGLFHLRDLPAGEYTVVVADGSDAPAIALATAASPPPTIELHGVAGERAAFHVVAPPAPDGRSDLTYRIVDEAGLPVWNWLGAFVQTSWQSDRFSATLVPGRYRVFVWVHGCREGSVEFDVPTAGTIEIPVERVR